MTARTYLAVLQVAFLTSWACICNTSTSQEFLRFEYGKTLVINEEGTKELIVLNGHADPVLYTSKAYITAWKVDSLEQLAMYLRSQSKSFTDKPHEVDDAKSQQIIFETGRSNSFSVGDSQLTWSPSSQDSGNLDLSALRQPVRVAVLNQRQRFPELGEKDFITPEEHLKRFDKARSERELQERRKALQPE